jgi:hypothetical protein
VKFLLTGVSALFASLGIHLGTPGWVLALAAAVVVGAVLVEQGLRARARRARPGYEALRPAKRLLQAVEAA